MQEALIYKECDQLVPGREGGGREERREGKGEGGRGRERRTHRGKKDSYTDTIQVAPTILHILYALSGKQFQTLH